MSVRNFWKREQDPVESALRAGRPEPRDELLAQLADRVAASRPTRRWSRVAFAGAMTVLMLGTFASFGGIGYAASSAQEAAKSITRIAKPAKQTKLAVRTTKSSAQDQYGQDPVTPVVNTKPKVANKPQVAENSPQVAGVFKPPAAVASSDELPFTGLGLGATAALGLLLLSLGALLRRRESRRE
jgi:hypothetical protein